MTIFVGSTNPVKINAVVGAASETWPEVQVHGYDVPSGIPEQPVGDEQTREGARNRAQRALERGSAQHPDEQLLGIGLEGGVLHYQGELWSTVWVAVVDPEGNVFESNGARFKVPDPIAQPILAGGEMGPVVQSLVGRTTQQVKQSNGAIGIVTQNFVDRTEEYTGIAKLALGLWYGRNWYQALTQEQEA